MKPCSRGLTDAAPGGKKALPDWWGGVAITLPKAWINYHRLKPGDSIEVVIDGDLIIRVKKPETKQE
jgi:hypothetical protein